MTNDQERFSLLPFITAIFVTILVLTPSASSKFISIGSVDLGAWSTGPLNIAGSTLFFPISYIFGDILTEVYGYQRSRRIIWVGFGCQLFAAMMYIVIQHWPAASFWSKQAQYEDILGQAPRIVLASLLAYFCGEFVNSAIVSVMKWRQGGKVGSSLASRFVVSTIFGELLDSCIFMFIGFFGVMRTPDILRTTITIWLLKVLYEVAVLPFTMRFTAWVKRRENMDVIDDPRKVSYSPFRI